MELLIVTAIIGILAAVIIPTFQGALRKANEASAVTTINAIKVAEAKYLTDHEGHYGTFDQLFKEGYLDKRFNLEKPHLKGYVFSLTLIDKPQRSAVLFQLSAVPELAEGMGATGSVFYYSEPDAGIFYSREGPADTDDKLL